MRSVPSRPRHRGLLAVLALALLGDPAAAAAASPQLLGNASPSTVVGLQIFDHTNLTGGSAPTGTISFALFGPGDTSCAAPIFTAAVAVSGTGSDNSPAYATPSAGTYCWIAAYGGDAGNASASTGCGNAAQTVTVSPTYAAEVTTAARSGGLLHATATISGGWSPTGTVTFTATGPDDQFCAGAPVFSSTVPVPGAGTYDSGTFAPTRAGAYAFRVRSAGTPTITASGRRRAWTRGRR